MDDNKDNTNQDQNTPADDVSENQAEVEEIQVSEEGAELVEENISEEIEVTEEELEKIEEKTKGHGLPDFRVGDTVKVMYKIIEGDKQRLQPFIGIVISIKGSDVSKTFTVRKIGADSIGVERIFPFYSPNIAELTVEKKGKVRRAKLYYLREKKGRAAMRIKERSK